MIPNILSFFFQPLILQINTTPKSADNTLNQKLINSLPLLSRGGIIWCSHILMMSLGMFKSKMGIEIPN